MDSKSTVGVIGVGFMGAGVAKNLVDAGYPVVVNDIDEARVDAMVAYGAESRRTPAEVARCADIVLSSLPEGAHVLEVALGGDGLIQAADAEFVYVDMSTVGPSVIRDVAAELERPGVQVIDAPVTGGQDGAEAATLRFMVGSDDPIPTAVEQVFDVLGIRTVHVGELGAGQVVKVCNNMISAASLISLSEAFVFAKKAGVSRQKLVEAMEGGTGETWVLENRASELIDHEFEPGFRGSYLYKDLRIGVKAAQKYGVPLPIGTTSHELFKSLEELGRGDLSASAIVTVVEDQAGMDYDLNG